MNKILAIGLIAAVTSSAYSECCCRSFYIGANFGVSFNTTKVKMKDVEYKTGDTYGGSGSGWKIVERGTNAENKEIGATEATMISSTLADLVCNKNRRGNILAELTIGYEAKLKRNFKAGIELNIGTHFGKTKFKVHDIVMHQGGRTGTISTRSGAYLNQQWHVSLMPCIGYQFRPDFEGYLTAGVKFARWKVKIPNMMTGEFADADEWSKISSTMKKKASIRVVPVVGAGVRYEFTPKIFGKLEYNYEFKTKAKLSNKMAPEYKKVTLSGHDIKLGIGYRF